MTYLRNKKDFETGLLLKRSLSFKGYIRRTSPRLVLKQYKKYTIYI